MRLVTLFTAMALGLAACGSSQGPITLASPTVPETYQARMDTGPDGEPLQIPAVRAAYLTERNQRQQVAYNGTEAPGTIVVDPYARVLYHVQPGGQAMRYGVAVGRAGTGYAGTATIARKATWPSWRPTDNMIRTQPDLYAQFSDGLSGGMHNPLGSRALYLYEGGRDTYYRIHGTMDPSSIGKATSAGCIRMFNQDVMDLFDQVENGTTVVVRSQAESVRMEGPMSETPEGYVVPAGQAPATAAAAASMPAQVTDPYAVTTVSTPASAPVVTTMSPVESAVQ
ncbi:L,D-transpeptidase [Paracoccus sediminis]|uniref:L,D-transpeptidase n=1 Tax=Paracoccus sediminis TaxID=1214787 RepID=A0A238W512_9RHOB|nr:L,D-transpeptidase [Paracoccus sediminis]TBN51586.1 L,D-transpeptidase [Paracoccus sediminis]SNR41695.1 Lipoprotein-anchoring transpeptidase ErfK/SrfK [Paracoccus sediminis]